MPESHGGPDNLLGLAFHHSPVGMGVVEQSRFVAVNNALCRILGEPASALVGASGHPLAGLGGRRFEDLPEEDGLGRVLRYEDDYRRADGSVVRAEVSAVPFASDEGQACLLVQLRDVTSEGRGAEHQPHRLPYDQLTGLEGPELFRDNLGDLLGQRTSSWGGLGVLLIGLDDLGTVNERFGRQAGDHVLQETARRLVKALRPSDTVARWGEDEFVVLLAGLRSDDEALTIVRRIRDMVFAPTMLVDGEMLKVRGSIGVAFTRPGERPTARRLLEEAGAAMSHARRDSSSGFAVFDAAVRDQADRRTRVEKLLRRAVDEDRLVLHYQPIIDLHRRRITAAGSPVPRRSCASVTRTGSCSTRTPSWT